MKKITFFEGLTVALISSMSGSLVFILMSGFVISDDLLKVIISALTVFYLGYLFLKSDVKIGRVTVIATWILVTVCSFLFVSSIFIYIVTQLLFIWLIRSFYFYKSVISSALDFMLVSIGLFVAMWVWFISTSLFLTFWCFFIIQALFYMIPNSFSFKTHRLEKSISSEDDFERAIMSAETAISNLVNSK